MIYQKWKNMEVPIPLKALGKSSAFSWRSSSAESQTTDPIEWTAERVLGAAALPSGPEEEM